MPPYDPLYRALTGYRRSGGHSAGYPLTAPSSGSYPYGAYTPIETGYVAQENAHEPFETTESPALYEPTYPPYENNSRDYEPVDPWSEPAVGLTPSIRFSAPVEDDVRPPEYDDALMDGWLTARAMDEIDGSSGTLDEIVNREDDTSLAPHYAELDRLAAGMDPLAPEAFRRLCDLPIDDLDEDQLSSAAAMLRLFAPPGAFGPGPGPLF